MFQTVVFPISKNLYLFLLAVILCGGIFLRFSPTASFKGRGFDEVVYAEYVSLLDSRSLLDYPAICQQYVELQKRRDEALLPPTRFLYVYAGHLCRVISHEAARAEIEMAIQLSPDQSEFKALKKQIAGDSH